MIKAIFVLILIVLATLYIPEDMRKEVRESIYQSYTVVKDYLSTDPQEKKDTYNSDNLKNTTFKDKNLREREIVEKHFFERGSDFYDRRLNQRNNNPKGEDIDILEGRKDTSLLQREEVKNKGDYDTFMKFYREMSHKLSHVKEILEDTHDKK